MERASHLSGRSGLVKEAAVFAAIALAVVVGARLSIGGSQSQQQVQPAAGIYVPATAATRRPGGAGSAEGVAHPGYVHPGIYRNGVIHPGGWRPGVAHPTGYRPSGYHPAGYHPGGYHPGGYRPGTYHPTGYHPGGFRPGPIEP